MTQARMTQEEKFLLKLYELACEEGGVSKQIDRYRVGNAIGQNDPGVDTVVRHLAQANFILLPDSTHVCLTPNGERLVHLLRASFLGITHL